MEGGCRGWDGAKAGLELRGESAERAHGLLRQEGWAAKPVLPERCPVQGSSDLLWLGLLDGTELCSASS